MKIVLRRKEFVEFAEDKLEEKYRSFFGEDCVLVVKGILTSYNSYGDIEICEAEAEDE